MKESAFGRRKSAGRVNRNPLRRITGYADRCVPFGGALVTLPGERLECGHIVPIKTDFVGETNATRRRCRECSKALRGDDGGGGGA